MTEQEIIEMQARLASLEKEKSELQAAKDALEVDKAAADEKVADLSAKLKEEVEKDAPLSFEISEDNEDLDVKEGDVFEFTAPTCTWDDNSIVNFRELAASKETKDQERYALICASLVQRKSGLIRRKED